MGSMAPFSSWWIIILGSVLITILRTRQILRDLTQELMNENGKLLFRRKNHIISLSLYLSFFNRDLELNKYLRLRKIKPVFITQITQVI